MSHLFRVNAFTIRYATVKFLARLAHPSFATIAALCQMRNEVLARSKSAQQAVNVTAGAAPGQAVVR